MRLLISLVHCYLPDCPENSEPYKLSRYSKITLSLNVLSRMSNYTIPMVCQSCEKAFSFSLKCYLMTSDPVKLRVDYIVTFDPKYQL